MSTQTSETSSDDSKSSDIVILQDFLTIMSVNTRELTVFVTPEELYFYVLSPTSHRQTLTIYNPYKFPVKYKVYSNARERYSVVNSEGNLPPESSVDLTVRHSAPGISNCNLKDLLKIVLHDPTNHQLLGKKIICTKLLPGEKAEGSVSDGSDDFEASQVSSQSQKAGDKAQVPDRQVNSPVQSHLVLLLIVLFAILMMPTKFQPQEATVVPDYLHINVGVKFFVSFLMGFVLCGILRPAGW